MESNDSNLTSDSANLESQAHRHSKRMRKPIQIYQPEFAQGKPKRREFTVNCKVLKSKKTIHNGKNFNFTVTSNLSVGSILKKFTKEASLDQFEHICVYYSEEHKSNL